MGKAQLSFLRVKPFAALFCLSAPTQLAWHRSTAVQAAGPFLVMLYWYCGEGLVHLLKKPHYFDHLGVINLWLRHNKNVGRFFL